MLIYKIPNASINNFWYVCDSQVTIDAIPVAKKTQQPIIDPALCSIGSQIEADVLLLQYQNDWLIKQNSFFVVNLQTYVEGGVNWTVVDLSTQPENTDRMYFVLDPTTGLYTEATGLDAAKTLLTQTQQIYLVFTNIDQYTTMTSWA